jgi:threonyl-tRNA synthetase
MRVPAHILKSNDKKMAIADSIKVHLPDGSIKEFPGGSTAHDVAMSISPRLAAAAVVARVRPVAAALAQSTTDSAAKGGEEAAPEESMYVAADAGAERLVDLSAPLHEDVELQLLTEKDAEALKVVRHSAAHVMATAVLELYPETKLGHGPATDAGFFYDFYRPTAFTPEDLKAIEG